MSSKRIKYNDDFEMKFSKMRIHHRTSSEFRETVKIWFKFENELCDWILNLWKYAKDMNNNETIETYALVYLELIKDHWNNEKYIDCEFLIDHLLRNDPSFFDFEVFIQAKDLNLNKLMIYDIIRKPN